MKSLRDRCTEFLDKIKRNAILRQGNPVDDLVAFVIAEQGRAAGGESFDNAMPLCLYFSTEQDRDEFVMIVKDAKPNWITKKV